MSTQNTAAGWYPDPNDGRQLRWWDGMRWTEHVSQPQPAQVLQQQVAPPQQAQAQQATPAEWPSAAPMSTMSSPGVDGGTPWIWLVLLMPLLPILPMLFIDWSGMFAIDPTTMQPDPAAQLGFLASPAYLLSVVGGWITYALSIVFSYLDFKTLRDRGIQSPFHWAWSFLSAYVYGIGRGVVVHRRTGRGLAVVWVAIAVIVLSIVLGVLVSLLAVAAVMSQVPAT